MTVRETIDFSARCLGTGTRFELLSELSRRERDAGIKPDPEIDAFMKAMAVEGKKNNIATDYILKVFLFFYFQKIVLILTAVSFTSLLIYRLIV